MPLTIKKRTSSSFAGKRNVLLPPGYPERTAPEEKTGRHSLPGTHPENLSLSSSWLDLFVKVK